MNVEEGTPLVQKEVVAEAPKSNNRTGLVVIFALVALSLIACVGYSMQPTQKAAPAVTDLRQQIKDGATKLMDSRSPENKKAGRGNEHLKAAIIKPLPGPFDYLAGSKVTGNIHAYNPLSTHGEDWFIEIDFFHHVSKVRYNVDGSEKDKITIGKMEGLDYEANIMAVDGSYCAAKSGPYHASVGLVCGKELKISNIEQKDPCWYVITVDAPHQCTNPVKSIGTPDEQWEARQRVDAVYDRP